MKAKTVMVKGVAMDKAYILKRLATDDIAVHKALVILYKRQTADEQQTRTTNHRNNRGFNSSDAPALTKYAKYLLSGPAATLGKDWLSDARMRLPKYAGQILEHYAEAQRAEAQPVKPVNLPHVPKP